MVYFTVEYYINDYATNLSVNVSNHVLYFCIFVAVFYVQCYYSLGLKLRFCVRIMFCTILEQIHYSIADYVLIFDN